MATLHVHAADNLMRTGTVLFCPDCDGDRIFVSPQCPDNACGDYSCTDCGAAVSLVVEFPAAERSRSSRVA